jgi:hypothetical protein
VWWGGAEHLLVRSGENLMSCSDFDVVPSSLQVGMPMGDFARKLPREKDGWSVSDRASGGLDRDLRRGGVFHVNNQAIENLDYEQDVPGGERGVARAGHGAQGRAAPPLSIKGAPTPLRTCSSCCCGCLPRWNYHPPRSEARQSVLLQSSRVSRVRPGRASSGGVKFITLSRPS